MSGQRRWRSGTECFCEGGLPLVEREEVGEVVGVDGRGRGRGCGYSITLEAYSSGSRELSAVSAS